MGIYLCSYTHCTCVRPMASREQGTIEQASLHETPVSDASRDATEATPLVTSNHRKYGKKSVLIKSKAAIMILFWTAFMSLIYGSFLNPEVYSILLNIDLSKSPIRFYASRRSRRRDTVKLTVCVCLFQL